MRRLRLALAAASAFVAVLLGAGGSSAASSGIAIQLVSLNVKGAVVTVALKNTGDQELVSMWATFPDDLLVTAVTSSRNVPAVCGPVGSPLHRGLCMFGTPVAVPGVVDTPPWHVGETITFSLTLAAAPLGGTKATFCGGTSVIEGPQACVDATLGTRAKICRCANVAVTANVSAFKDTASDARISFAVTWRMTCGGGTGKCSGGVEILPPQGTDITVTGGKTVIGCNGACGKKTKKGVATGRFSAEAVSTHDLLPENRRSKHFVFYVRPYCNIDGRKTPFTAKGFLFQFDDQGKLGG